MYELQIHLQKYSEANELYDFRKHIQSLGINVTNMRRSLTEGNDKLRRSKIIQDLENLHNQLAGYLEACLKEEIGLFVERRCPANIKNYILSSLQNTTNLTHSKIQKALQNFSDDWCEHYTNNATDEMIQSIGSIYSNRNRIAHGQNCNISLCQLKEDYENVQQVVEAIHNAITNAPYAR